ncbi:hypothetical protein LAZ67_18002479 [Cordylochernes scorpioides]|uniref:CCHC-type domain-containing protein n=1 Tax=Cordylochernes scorpioides TaxID=51811 RepID=A0ABY6LGY6_9ARAC|nr:hypothetical protein LAZ67_18002479 [Cordylochernes scorpioides]
MSQNYNCVAPEPFNFSNPGDWPKWIRRFERFRQASGLINNPENEQVNMLVYCMGDNADDILLSCKIASHQLENYGKVIECFESHFIPRRNIIYERARFNQRCQQEGEKVNEFITALHSLAEHCNFGMLHDELIRDRIVVGVRDRALSERMQLDTDLTLVKATLMAKQLESVKEQQSSLYQQDSVDQIKKMPNHIKEAKRHEPKIRQFKSNQLGGSSHGCTRCGNSNNHDWKNCPAMNSHCSKCKKKGHYAKVCRSETINEIKSKIAFLGSVEDNSKKWIVPIKVNNRQINFKIDTGADVNVLPLQYYYQSFQRIKLEKSDKILQGPNGIPLETVGMIHVKLQNKGQHLNSKIYIVDKLKQPLLSGETSEKLNIVRMIQQLSSGGRGGQRGRLGSGDNRGCYNCGEEGHRKFECTKPARGGGRGRGQSRDGGSNNTCYNCGEVGHRKYESTNNTAEDGGQEENQRKSKKACYTCGEFGHKKDDCPKSGTQESGDEEESSDNEEEETPQKRKQAEDSEKEEVEAEEPPKKKSKKSKKKEEDCYLTLQAYRTMPLESARSRKMRRPPLRHQPGSQGDARMTRSKRPRRIALHQRPHLQEMEGCRGTTKTRIQRRASLQCQPCIQDGRARSQDITDSPVPKSRQDSGRQGTSKQIDHCLYRKMEQGREENPKEPMESDPDSESGENNTFPKKETTLGRTQEVPPNHEDVTPPPPVSDVLGSLARTIYQLSSATGLSRDVELPRYDGSYEAQSFFDNYDAQADLAQLHYTERLRRLPNLLQGKALHYFRSLKLDKLYYVDARQALIDLFPETTNASFARFLAIKLTDRSSLEEYYQKKTVCGLQLNLPHKILLESLTDGLPVADQRIVAAVQPNTLQAWYSVVSRVRGTHSASQVCQQTTRTTPNPSFAPSPRYSAPRPWSTRPNYSANPPPSSCRYCGAMHWHAQCPKRPAQSRPRPVYRATTYPQHDRTVLSSPAPFRVNNTRAHVTRSPDPLYTTSPAQAVNPSYPMGTSTTAPKQACSDAQDSTTMAQAIINFQLHDKVQFTKATKTDSTGQPGIPLPFKAKTSLEDDDVPIDDTTTKPLFTPQEKGRKGTRDKVPRLRWNPWQKHVRSMSVQWTLGLRA